MLCIVLHLCVSPEPKWLVDHSSLSCSGYIRPQALFACADSARLVCHNNMDIVAQSSITYMSCHASVPEQEGYCFINFQYGAACHVSWGVLS